MRTVRLKLGSENNTQRELVQPIAKIVLLVEGDSPTESQGEGSQMKRVRDNFSHMRPFKYICHCVQIILRSYMLKVSNVTLRQSSAERCCNVVLVT